MRLSPSTRYANTLHIGFCSQRTHTAASEDFRGSEQDEVSDVSVRVADRQSTPTEQPIRWPAGRKGYREEINQKQHGSWGGKHSTRL